MMKKLFKTIISGIYDACLIWKDEMRQIFKDEGVLIFFILVPLGYPLLYSWIYNNEVVREVPVVVVDDSLTVVVLNVATSFLPEGNSILHFPAST